jgi:hypothetical protein
MGSLRFTDIQTRPTEVLDLTSLPVDEFQPLVPPFETAFQAHRAAWRLDRQPRMARRYTTDHNCPAANPRGSTVVYRGLREDLSPPGGAGAAGRDGPTQGSSVDSCLVSGPAGDAVHTRGCPDPVLDGVGPAPW